MLPKREYRNPEPIDWEGFEFPKEAVVLPPAQFKALVRRVKEADRWRCRVCRCGSKALEAHHMVPRARLRLDTLENLLTLCWECHQRAGLNEIEVWWVDSRGGRIGFAGRDRAVKWRRVR